MDIGKHSSRDGLITCDICMKEIPVSEVKNEEAADYVIYFFGLDCFATWRTQTVKKKKSG